MLFTFNATADVFQAQQDYQVGHYQQSFKQFTALAKLGLGAAQIGLAQSYAFGHGTEQDPIKAFAWVMLAQQNQHPAATALYNEYRTKVPSRRQAKVLYQQLKDQYGQAALKSTLYPLTHDTTLAVVKAAIAISTPEPQYPITSYEAKRNVWAIARYDVDENGVPNNIAILTAYPNASINQAVNQELVKWRYQPSYDQHNNPIRHHNQIQLFELFAGQGDFHHSELHQDIYSQAQQGSAPHQYLYGKWLQTQRINNTAGQSALSWLIRAGLNGDAQAQFELYQCLSVEGHCQVDHNKAQLWLKLARANQHPASELATIVALLQDDPHRAIELLQPLMASNNLDALILYAKLLATSEVATIKDSKKAIKYARQAMALDNNNPQLLAILAITYYSLNKPDKGQTFLLNAIKEAEYRHWPIDYYVNLLEDYQRATFLDEH